MGVIGNMGANALMKFPHFCTMCRLSIVQIMVRAEKGKGARTDGAEMINASMMLVCVAR